MKKESILLLSLATMLQISCKQENIEHASRRTKPLHVTMTASTSLTLAKLEPGDMYFIKWKANRKNCRAQIRANVLTIAAKAHYKSVAVYKKDVDGNLSKKPAYIVHIKRLKKINLS